MSIDLSKLKKGDTVFYANGKTSVVTFIKQHEQDHDFKVITHLTNFHYYADGNAPGVEEWSIIDIVPAGIVDLSKIKVGDDVQYRSGDWYTVTHLILDDEDPTQPYNIKTEALGGWYSTNGSFKRYDGKSRRDIINVIYNNVEPVEIKSGINLINLKVGDEITLRDGAKRIITNINYDSDETYCFKLEAKDWCDCYTETGCYYEDDTNEEDIIAFGPVEKVTITRHATVIDSVNDLVVTRRHEMIFQLYLQQIQNRRETTVGLMETCAEHIDHLLSL